jgi:hypothetical protein
MRSDSPLGTPRAILAFFAMMICFAGAAFASPDAVKAKYGKACEIEETCGDMLYVDCNSEIDGPAYYLDKEGEIIGTAGGFCHGQSCTGAPPRWTDCMKAKEPQMREDQ